jgi:hypothetical protein
MCFLIESSRILEDELLDILYAKIKVSKENYLLMDSHTKSAFIDADSKAELFSSLEFASAAVDYFGEDNRKLDIVLLADTEIVFEQLYRDGFKYLILDNGQYHITIPIIDLIDITKIEESGNPIINGELKFSVQELLQEAAWDLNYEEKQDVLEMKEQQMLNNLVCSKLYVPINCNEALKENMCSDNTLVLDGSQSIELISIINSQTQKKYIPGFSSISEMSKIYQNDDAIGLLLPFEEIAQISTQTADGFVLDYSSINLIIPNSNIKSILNMK